MSILTASSFVASMRADSLVRTFTSSRFCSTVLPRLIVTCMTGMHTVVMQTAGISGKLFHFFLGRHGCCPHRLKDILLVRHDFWNVTVDKFFQYIFAPDAGHKLAFAHRETAPHAAKVAQLGKLHQLFAVPHVVGGYLRDIPYPDAALFRVGVALLYGVTHRKRGNGRVDAGAPAFPYI